MSRKEVAGKTHDLAFGVDHETGAFVQIWVKPANDQDCAMVVIDDRGVRIEPTFLKEFEKLEPSAKIYISDLRERLKASPGHHIGEEHINELARRIGGFPNISKEVHEALD